MKVKEKPFVVQILEPRPRGLFSRLIWRFLRYDWLEPNDIMLTIKPSPSVPVTLHAVWWENILGEEEEFEASLAFRGPDG